MTRRRALVVAAAALLAVVAALAVWGGDDAPDDDGRVRVSVEPPGPPRQLGAGERDAWIDECVGASIVPEDLAYRDCSCLFDEYLGPDNQATEDDFQQVFDDCYDRAAPPTTR